MLQKARLLQCSEHVHGDATRHVDATCSQYLHREITGLTAKNRDEHVNGFRAYFAGTFRVGSLIDDHHRWIACRTDQLGNVGVLRQFLDIAKVSVNVRNADARTDVFKADVLETLKHVLQEPDLPFVRGSKVRMTTFGAVSKIAVPIPGQEGFPEARTRCNHTYASSGYRFTNIDR